MEYTNEERRTKQFCIVRKISTPRFLYYHPNHQFNSRYETPIIFALIYVFMTRELGKEGA